jgi:hypothetical protein
MSKKLNEEKIQNELRGASVFFRPERQIDNTQPPISEESHRPINEEDTTESANGTSHASTTRRYRDTTIPSYQDIHIEGIRKAVRQLGKEAATYRFTREEKKALADIVYSCRNKDIRTSENELTRIAVNFIIQDHCENNQQSILTRVLERLNE